MIVLIWMYGDGQRWLEPIDTDNPPAWLGGTFTLPMEQEEAENEQK